MPPAMMILRVSVGRGILVPLPAFLLWPILALAYLLIGLLGILTLRPPRRAGFLRSMFLALEMYRGLSGLQVRIRRQDGSPISIRVV